MNMIPGEIFVLDGRIEFNTGRDKLLITVSNFGDRPVQVGSHFHFYEVNTCLVFDRSITYGFRLDIMAGTSVRFEAGQCKDVHLVNYVGYRVVNGFRKMVMGKLESN